MALLSHDEMKKLCLSVGFTEGEALVMAAISLAESGIYVPVKGATYSDSDAVGDVTLMNETWGTSLGHFQIRSLAKPGESFRNREFLKDSAYNARAARLIYMGPQGFTAWSVFKNGSYLKHFQGEQVHTVVAGETVWSIGQKYNVSYKVLAERNNLGDGSLIEIGMELRIPRTA